MASLQQQIGVRIKKFRRLKGYTQSELAKLVHISTNYVGYIERGERTVSLQTLERLAHILGVEVGTFFLFHAQETNKRLRASDRKMKILGKLTAFLQDADNGDLKLLFKLAKRLVLNARPHEKQEEM